MKKIISLLFILVIFGGSYYYFYINDNQISTTAYEYSKIEKAALYAKKKSLFVHAGHGLTYNSAKKISSINCIRGNPSKEPPPLLRESQI